MRVRWGNVGRAVVVVGVLALAVLWPRLQPPAPRLPSDVGRSFALPAAPAGTARVRKRSGAVRTGTARVRKGSGAGRRRTARVSGPGRRGERAGVGGRP